MSWPVYAACKIVTGQFSITKIPRRNYRGSTMERRFIETHAKLRPFHDGMSCAILLAATAPFASAKPERSRAHERIQTRLKADRSFYSASDRS